MVSELVKIGGVKGAGNRRKTIGRRGLKIVEEMAAKGHPDTAIAQHLNIYRKTFADICKRQPEVQEALDRGRAALESVLVHSLVGRALNETSKGGTTAAIFLLKSRCGYEGTKLPPHMTVNQTNILNVELPTAMDMKEYLRRVSAGSSAVIEGDVSDSSDDDSDE